MGSRSQARLVPGPSVHSLRQASGSIVGAGGRTVSGSGSCICCAGAAHLRAATVTRGRPKPKSNVRDEGGGGGSRFGLVGKVDFASGTD
jgi:hypothetical protein